MIDPTPFTMFVQKWLDSIEPHSQPIFKNQLMILVRSTEEQARREERESFAEALTQRKVKPLEVVIDYEIVAHIKEDAEHPDPMFWNSLRERIAEAVRKMVNMELHNRTKGGK